MSFWQSFPRHRSEKQECCGGSAANGRGRRQFCRRVQRHGVQWANHGVGRTDPHRAGLKRIALAGNPNAGKTSVFNLLTGARQHVANFPGVTVERKEGDAECCGCQVTIVDLPGTYSLTAYSIEEIVARNHLVDERPDLVVDVLDSSNLQRNLYLATQLLELDIPLVLVANMVDVARHRGMHVDLEELSRQLQLPVVAMEGHRGNGLHELRQVIHDCLKCPCKEEQDCPGQGGRRVEFGESVETLLGWLEQEIDQHWRSEVKQHPPARWLALRLLERDARVRDHMHLWLHKSGYLQERAEEISAGIEQSTGIHTEIYLANCRYEFIQELMQACRQKQAPRGLDGFRTDRVDRVLLHRFWGVPIFLGLMFLTFWLTFTLGSFPMDWIDAGFSSLAGWLDGVWPGSGPLKGLVIDGVIGGVGGVLVFLPNILLLFTCLSLMEDTGYMARAAFLLDRLMQRIGLHGKAFIPLLTGFGCSIPGIMGTRVMENERDRLLTILVLPLMSCGARLPIYLLIIPAFFPVHLHASMLFSIYLIGVVLAVGLAKLLKISVFRGPPTPFVMEMPPYKVPTLRSVYLQLRNRSWMYVHKAGTLILGVSVLLWVLASLPHPASYKLDYDGIRQSLREQTAQLAGVSPAGLEEQALPPAIRDSLIVLDNLQAEEDLEYSLLGRLGKAIEPVMQPMGFDWKISASFLGAFAAKEVFVAQMGVVYAMGETDEGSTGLRDILRERYRPLVGFCIMLFALIATPCMATFAVTRRETGTARWAWFQLLGLTAVAWLLTTAVYQAGSLLGL